MIKTVQEMQKELAESKILYKQAGEKIENCDKSLQSSPSTQNTVNQINNERIKCIKELDNLSEKILDLKMDIKNKVVISLDYLND